MRGNEGKESVESFVCKRRKGRRGKMTEIGEERGREIKERGSERGIEGKMTKIRKEGKRSGGRGCERGKEGKMTELREKRGNEL